VSLSPNFTTPSCIPDAFYRDHVPPSVTPDSAETRPLHHRPCIVRSDALDYTCATLERYTSGSSTLLRGNTVPTIDLGADASFMLTPTPTLPRSPHLVVFGDIALDLAAHVQSFPQPGRDSVVDTLRFAPGGSAANCAAIAGKLGADVEFIGVTGDDAQSQWLVSDLEAHGVKTGHIQRVQGAPAVIIALISTDGERTFASYRGVNAQAQPTPQIDGLFATGDILHLTGYSYQAEGSAFAADHLLSQAQAHKVRIALDPSYRFARELATDALLAKLDFLLPNLQEAELLTGEADPLRAAAQLRDRGVQTVIVKLGAEGCLILDAGGVHHVPACPVSQVVDSIGAGDAFCGGFLAAVLGGAPIRLAAHLGHAVASSVVQAAGAREGALTFAQAIDTLRAATFHQEAAQLIQLLGGAALGKHE